MKDIKLDNWFLKLLYIQAWFFALMFGGLPLMIIVLVFVIKQNKLPGKKWVVKKTYQKIVWVYGLIMMFVFIFLLMLLSALSFI